MSNFSAMYLSVVALEARDAFTTLPMNTMGVIGQNVTLNCALSDPTTSLIWKNPRRLVVYESWSGITDDGEGHFLVEKINGNIFNLVILNTEAEDAGQYTCQCVSPTSSAFAQVILLGTCTGHITPLCSLVFCFLISGHFVYFELGIIPCVFPENDPALGCTESTSNPVDDDFGNTVVGEQITLNCQTTYYSSIGWGPTQIWKDSTDQTLPASEIPSGNIIEYTHTVSIP